jgi:hypothetical protein
MDRRVRLYEGGRGLNAYYGPQLEVAVHVGHAFIPVDIRILKVYLPRLARTRTMDYTNTVDVNQLVWRSANVQRGQVRPQIMKYTLHKVIHSLGDEVSGSGGPSLRLISFLERTLRRHQLPHRRNVLGESYQYFASLAEIARMCDSERIHGVLEKFFSKHGNQIAEEESTYGLFEWARAIICSNMKDAAMSGCLREILLVRPTFDQEMEKLAFSSGSSLAMQLVRSVQDILSRMSRSDFEPMERGRGYFRRGAVTYRRYTASPYRNRVRPRRPLIPARAFSSGIVPTRSTWDAYSVGALARPAEIPRIHLVKQQMDQIQYRQRNVEEMLEEVAEKAETALELSTGHAHVGLDDWSIGSNWGDEVWD